MRESAERYISSKLAAQFRSWAFRVWTIALAVVLVWVLAIVIAPVARANSISLAEPIYAFFSYMCHQMPERSLHLMGHQLGVCSRCFGVYFGLFAGFAVYPLWRQIESIEPVARVWLFLSLIPIAIDWSLSIFGIWDNTHLSRFVTGLILGVSCATFIVPAIVEIHRNLSLRRIRAT